MRCSLGVCLSFLALFSACTETNSHRYAREGGGGTSPGLPAIPSGVPSPIPSQSPSPVVLPTVVPTIPQNSECYKAEQKICDIEALITQKTNALRGASRSQLKQNSMLSYVAREWSKVQGNRGDIGHDGFPNQRQTLLQKEFGSQNLAIEAENVAMSYSSDQSAESVAAMFTDMWANSSGHRANMLGNFALIGVGVAQVGDSWYATQIFGEN